MSTETPLFVDRSINLSFVSTETTIFMDRSLEPTVVSTKTHLFVDRRQHGAYAPPTNPRVATLILTPGGKTARSARKQANKVEPVVKTSSISIMCRNCPTYLHDALNASWTFRTFSSVFSLV